MGRYFGTDGVRGLAGGTLDPALAYKLGRAAAHVATGEKPRFLLGMDTRISGHMLESALASGLMAGGCDVCFLGVAPTPAIAFLTKKLGFDGGVVISASHNPYYDNGIKFFDSQGFKLPDEKEDLIEAVMADESQLLPKTHQQVGKRIFIDHPLDEYINFSRETALKATGTKDLSGLSIGLDFANGATFPSSLLAFEGLGANLSLIHNEPNGLNINDNCGSTHMESLIEMVKTKGLSVGFAFDGDGDRCLAVDETGEIVDGDQILAILGVHFKSQGLLRDNTVVATVMTNLGFINMANEQGLSVETTKVGDRYVLERMQQGGFVLGGEQSGHVIMLDYATTGDGLLCALMIAGIMAKTGKKLSELSKVMTVLPQSLINAKVAAGNKEKYMENDIVKEGINRLEQKYAGAGRVLIRPSGTEHLVRVMIEGADLREITEDAAELVRLIEECLG